MHRTTGELTEAAERTFPQCRLSPPPSDGMKICLLCANIPDLEL